MNLFVIGWKLPQEQQLRLLNELAAMSKFYPQLDVETLWSISSDDNEVTTASMRTGDSAAAPREYVDLQDNGAVLFSGLPINPDGSFLAHRAEQLAANWKRLDASLEGIYSLARVTTTPCQVEIQTDILGFEQVFYTRRGDAWVISNSVRLIENIIGLKTLDPIGVSTYLSMGWVGGEHTLRSEIKSIPGGQRWIWEASNSEPERKTYYSPSRLAGMPRRDLTEEVVAELADNMKRCLSVLKKHFPDDITCPLTGGRDSRLLAALLSGAGASARYYTFGKPGGKDAEIAAQVARILGLDYEVKPVSNADVNYSWDEVCQTIVRQSDGMYPLQLMAGVLAFLNNNVDKLDIRIWGVGGEIARGFYNNSGFYLKRHDVADVQQILAQSRTTDQGGLLRSQSVELARDYVRKFVEEKAGDGFLPEDIPDVMYTYERVGSRGGKNMRMSMAIRDAFSPFCTRPFIEATFSVPAAQRYTEPLHYQLIRHLSPELHRLPFDSKPWRSQNSKLNLVKSYGALKLGRIEDMIRRRIKKKKVNISHIVKDTMFDRKGWFERNREKIREVCLDQKDSVLWDSVDRLKFDQVTSSKTGASERSRYLTGLYPIATLFYYEAERILRSSE